jgi:hypothetical protein
MCMHFVCVGVCVCVSVCVCVCVCVVCARVRAHEASHTAFSLSLSYGIHVDIRTSKRFGRARTPSNQLGGWNDVTSMLSYTTDTAQSASMLGCMPKPHTAQATVWVVGCALATPHLQAAVQSLLCRLLLVNLGQDIRQRSCQVHPGTIGHEIEPGLYQDSVNRGEGSLSRSRSSQVGGPAFGGASETLA